jgi:hypothetical protein
MTKAAMARLKKSKFFEEVQAVLKAWDYYLESGDKALVNETMQRWEMAKLALEHITGNTYVSIRGGGTYSVVNRRDHNDRLLTGISHRRRA